jgi:hypothetical protein
MFAVCSCFESMAIRVCKRFKKKCRVRWAQCLTPTVAAMAPTNSIISIVYILFGSFPLGYLLL